MQPSIATDPVVIKQYIDTQLAEYFAQRITDSAPLGASYTQLWLSMRSLVMAGGKRFRPYMLLLAHHAYAPSEESRAVLPAALAQELIHQAMLIHDDIIDRDTIRYGMDNIAGQYHNAHYQPYIQDSAERDHMAASAALLAGDVLISDAHQLITTLDKPTDIVRTASSLLNTAVFEVAGGELLDTEVSFLPAGSISAEIIARYKTASYSFVSPLTMGAVLAGAPKSEVSRLTELSLHLGIGYQLRDDLIGMFGDSDKTGKSTTTDITEGKRTFLIEAFDTHATDAQKATFAPAFHNLHASEEQIALSKQALVESGAKKIVEDEIEKRHSAAIACIAELTLPPDSKEAFYTLANTCLSREA